MEASLEDRSSFLSVGKHFSFYNVPVLSPGGNLQNGSPIASINPWELKYVICLDAESYRYKDTASLSNEKIVLLTVTPLCISLEATTSSHLHLLTPCSKSIRQLFLPVSWIIITKLNSELLFSICAWYEMSCFLLRSEEELVSFKLACSSNSVSQIKGTAFPCRPCLTKGATHASQHNSRNSQSWGYFLWGLANWVIFLYKPNALSYGWCSA